LDGRSASRVVVTITPAGREIYQQVMAVAQRYQMQLLDLMTADERRVIASLLRRIEHYLSSGAA
jgi:DNA-binding MarR family transcriptional regulator